MYNVHNINIFILHHVRDRSNSPQTKLSLSHTNMHATAKKSVKFLEKIRFEVYFYKIFFIRKKNFYNKLPYLSINVLSLHNYTRKPLGLRAAETNFPHYT